MILFRVVKSLLRFIASKTIELAFWVGSLFYPAFRVLNHAHHPSKWIWLNGNLCLIDTLFVKHVKRLHLAGYETTECCQGSDFSLGTSSYFTTPYICARALPRAFIEACIEEGFCVKCCLRTKWVCVYARRSDAIDDLTPGASQRNFDTLNDLLNTWYQDQLLCEKTRAKIA